MDLSIANVKRIMTHSQIQHMSATTWYFSVDVFKNIIYTIKCFQLMRQYGIHVAKISTNM